MSAVTYDLYQQVFGLSMISNRAASYTGSPVALQTQLQWELACMLQGVPQGNIPNGAPYWPAPALASPLDGWTLAWGPAVYQAPKYDNVLDNAVFVASQSGVTIPGIANTQSLTVYVVAIAATNPSSFYDWAIEDGNVVPVVDFSTYDPTNVQPVKPSGSTTPYLSMGTATGVSNLLTQMPSPNGAVASGQSLAQFLTSIPDPANSAVIFTGHSLAGALSPTLALYLLPQLTAQKFAAVLVYPTAGATPGEGNFAARFAGSFPATTPGASAYQVWNTDLWNYYDVVPHAWNPAILAEIATLYGNSAIPHPIEPHKYPPYLAAIAELVKWAIAHSNNSGVVYTRLRNAALNAATPSSLQPYTDYFKPKDAALAPATGVPLPLPPASDEDFVVQLAIQHVNMYAGLPSFTYYPSGSTTLQTTPQVDGLILPQPLPKPAKTLLPGVTALSTDDIIADILKDIRSLLP